MTTPQPTTTVQAPIHLPRIAITYCTQCKWALRANYFSQELQSTFGTALGEVAVIPATGGIFQVHLTYREGGGGGNGEVKEVLIWDRKAEGGFPETKVLKQLVRDCVEPGRGLGHSDRGGKQKGGGEGKGEVDGKGEAKAEGEGTGKEVGGEKEGCEDCK